MAEPVMPDPRRTVSAGVSVLRRIGVGDYEALCVIALCAETAGKRLTEGGNPKVGWLRLVWKEAERRKRPAEQAREARKEDRNGK